MFVDPEIQRSSLEETVLKIKALDLGLMVEDFLADMLCPPNRIRVKNAVELLILIGAINDR